MTIHLQEHSLKTLLQNPAFEIGCATHGISFHLGPCILYHHHAILVIGIGNGKSLARQSIKECLLGIAIVLKGLMVIQMITRQIGEDTSGKGESTYAMLCHTVAAHLHEGIFATFVGHAAQEIIECDGIGSGTFCGDGLSVNIVAYGTAQATLVTHAAEDMIEDGGNGGLAIGTGHAYELHPLSGITHAGRCQWANSQLRIGIHQIGDAGMYVLGNGLTHDGFCSLCNGFVYEFMTINLSSPKGHKHVTRLHTSGIYLYAIHLSVHSSLDV